MQHRSSPPEAPTPLLAPASPPPSPRRDLVRRAWSPLLFLGAIGLMAACENAIAPVDTTPEPDPDPQPEAIDYGHCVYANPFSKSEECREYKGEAWTEDDVRADCDAQTGVLSDGACGYADTLGTCVLGSGSDKETHVVIPGNDAKLCNVQKVGCEVFAKGLFEPSKVCEGGGDPLPPAEGVFQPPERICKDPLAGEPAGQSENGQVCTWGMISGCTEPGRKFTDYASCDPVYTQRPYYPVDPAPPPASPDPRMDDPAYVAELDWVKSQVEACACVCCHDGEVAPQGAAIWDIRGEGNWMSTFSEYGLAFAGGILDSSLLGAYPKEENNGFIRENTGLPSTEPDRLRLFFENELKDRGMSSDDFANSSPVPEFFYEQSIFEPAACAKGEGVDAEGNVVWAGGDARYVYVLETGSDNPGVPPNLDKPQGTVWRLDVPPTKAALKSGSVAFGAVPQNTVQSIPEDGTKPALTSGKTYYLYVLADVAIPITRCLFTAP